MQIDYISDLHLDFYNDMNRSYKEDIWKKLHPNKQSEILIIAGDIGHNNSQNIEFLKKATTFYPYVLFVLGNHDYYTFTNQNYIDRISEMKNLKIEGLFNLDGNVININGINFGGADGWYDGTYSKQVLKTIIDVDFLWQFGMNDSKLIRENNDRLKSFMPLFVLEYQKILKIHKKTDIMITHVSPDWSNPDKRFKNEDLTSFFYFDGKELLKDMKEKLWFHGHTHKQQSYINDSVNFYCNPFGYPTENIYTKGIKTIEL